MWGIGERKWGTNSRRREKKKAKKEREVLLEERVCQ
jgi:hypothetical protein